MDIFKDNDYYQVRTKSNVFTIKFDDAEKENIFLEIVSEINKKTDLSLKLLISRIHKKKNEAKVIDVLEKLNEYKLLPFELASNLSLDSKSDTYQYSSNIKQVKDVTLVVFGQDNLSEKIKLQAKKESFKKVESYSYNQNRQDLKRIIKNSDFIIVDANEWSPYHIEIINQLALRYNKPWLYVIGVEKTSLKIGPLFYGEETGCYNCLISRLKSNHEYPAFLQSYENYLRKNKTASKPDIIPNTDILYNIIANISLLEVVKFFEKWSLPVTWRAILDIDITTFNFTKHILLKKPFCEVCKPELEYAPSPWLEAVTLK